MPKQTLLALVGIVVLIAAVWWCWPHPFDRDAAIADFIADYIRYQDSSMPPDAVRDLLGEPDSLEPRQAQHSDSAIERWIYCSMPAIGCKLLIESSAGEWRSYSGDRPHERFGNSAGRNSRRDDSGEVRRPPMPMIVH